jgi:hypothetical protein
MAGSLILEKTLDFPKINGREFNFFFRKDSVSFIFFLNLENDESVRQIPLC